jgi:hypothetical protein
MRFPLWLSWLLLVGLLVLAWQLHLPEGWPRFVAFGVLVVAFVWLFAVSVKTKSLNDQNGPQ